MCVCVCVLAGSGWESRLTDSWAQLCQLRTAVAYTPNHMLAELLVFHGCVYVCVYVYTCVCFTQTQVKAALGGKIKLVISGAAPLSLSVRGMTHTHTHTSTYAHTFSSTHRAEALHGACHEPYSTAKASPDNTHANTPTCRYMAQICRVCAARRVHSYSPRMSRGTGIRVRVCAYVCVCVFSLPRR